METITLTYEIHDIDLWNKYILIFVHEADIDKSADVTIYFDWQWNKAESDRIPDDIRFDIEFKEQQGNEIAVTNYVNQLINNQLIQEIINQ